ncbi:ankyrin repeat-containing domain protein [Mycena leptocephala]|nr:ankyrin repeat-containing domain protein [Mycena leptocephala]
MLVDEKTRNTLDKWLRPSVHVADSQCNAANARHPKTGLWLLERPEFREWIYAPGSLLWLHGMSGSGKTVLSSTIIDTIHARAEHYVYFYFDTNNSEQQTVTQLLRSLVTQLSIRSNPPDGMLDALWISHNGGQKLLTDEELISDALLPLLKEFNQKPIFIVLDALDECSERSKLLRLISRMLDAKLPHVHILVTSRPEVQVGHPELVEVAVSVSLEGCVDGDIELYLSEVLSQETGWIYEKRDEIKTGLLERSNGMFRLATLQLGELRNCDGRQSQVKKVLKNMPTSLNAIYDRILQNIKNPDILSSVCRAMNWLVFSKRPMTLDEIIDALAFDFECEPLLFNTEERMGSDALLAACAGFVAISKNTVKLAHSSVKEYFLHATRLRLSGDCEISDQAAHHLLARTCIAYLCSFDHVLNTDADLEQYPLTLYAVENWARTETVSSLLPLHIAASLGIGQIVWELLEQGADLNEQGGRFGSTLQAVSYWGHIEIARLLLGSGADVNAQGGKYSNALQAASLRGHIEIPWLLLKSGADVNTQGGEYGSALQATGADVNAQGGPYGNALQAASFWGRIEIAHLLLGSGANVNVQGGWPGNALQAASLRGHIEIACLLLHSGADVNMQGGEYGNALQAASYSGQIEIARLLLESGADVNMQGGEYSNALQAASYSGHIKIARLLLESGADVNTQGRKYSSMLQAASLIGGTRTTHLLCEKGATVNAADEDDEKSGGSVADRVL